MTAKLLLVGAGPGDPELITIKAIKALEKADVILYDNLVNQDVFQHIKNSSPRIYVGKKAGEKHNSQEKINEMILTELKQNKTVVRLKAGDPFVFARGVEEQQVAIENGFDCEIIPGLSSGLALPVSAGIALTLRKKSDSLCIVTGHELSPEKIQNWHNLLASGATLIIYMALINIQEIQKQLLSSGIKKDLSIAAISRGGFEDEKIIYSSLENINKDSQKLISPVIFVLGKHIKAANQ